MDKERQMYQLHKKGYEDIQKAIQDIEPVSIEIHELLHIQPLQLTLKYL